jgi:hypothetical protein
MITKYFDISSCCWINVEAFGNSPNAANQLQCFFPGNMDICSREISQPSGVVEIQVTYYTVFYIPRYLTPFFLFV